MAHVWRRSWNLISGKPALLRSGLKEAVARLRKSRGLPPWVQKIKVLSCHIPPSLSRSAFWAALWTLSASTVWPSITSVTSRSGIPAGLSAWALAEALPGALPKMSSSPAAGDEQGEGVAVLGGGDVEGKR